MLDVPGQSVKIRRSSFSNSLSELPEVEEPDQPEPWDLFRKKLQVIPLPPILDANKAYAAVRPRLNTMPNEELQSTVLEGRTEVLQRSTSTEDAIGHKAEDSKLQHLAPAKLSATLKAENERKQSKSSQRRWSKDSGSSRRSSISSDASTSGNKLRPKDLSPPRGILVKGRRSSHDPLLGKFGSVFKDRQLSYDFTKTKQAGYEFSEHRWAAPNATKDRRLADGPLTETKRLSRPRSFSYPTALEKLSSSSSSENVDSPRESVTSDRSDSKSSMTSFRSRRSTLPDNYLKRRWSRPSFAETSRRVDMLLRVTKSFKIKNADDSVTERVNHFLSEHMPKEPRFSAFLSPEALYALMKGYEDKIHDKLATSHPEYEGILKRNKTPHRKINIRRRSSITGLDDAWEEEEEEEEEDEDQDQEEEEGEKEAEGGDGQEKTFLTTKHRRPSLTMGVAPEPGHLARELPLLPATQTSSRTENTYCSLQPFESYGRRRQNSISNIYNVSATHYNATGYNNSNDDNYVQPADLDSRSVQSEPMHTSPQVALRNLRRLSYSLERGTSASHFFRQELDADLEEAEGGEGRDGEGRGLGGGSLQRFSSLPNVCVLPHERRLDLSQRLENAMDLLDAVKNDSELSLSPRVKARSRKITPLSDYNTWAGEWSREFQMNNSNHNRSND